MRLNEFSTIERFFKRRSGSSSSVLLGIGDDCALLKPPRGQVLAVTTDTLVSGAHFFSDADPEGLGHKTLAVNLSDLAAMGASPAWMTLALTLPCVEKNWLTRFCKGFFDLADRCSIELVGGDLTKGPLSMTVQAMGFVPAKKALRRDAAKAGDAIYVSGFLGDARVALSVLKKQIKVSKQDREALLHKLEFPEPRIELGKALRGKAHAAIDLSDGLMGDLDHILERSQKGATIFLEKLPLSCTLQRVMPLEQARMAALHGGDDYELCFTVSDTREMRKFLQKYSCRWIGYIEHEPGLRVRDEKGKRVSIKRKSYRHF